MRKPISIETDERFLRAAIREALKGVGLTAPNPAVGAVIVKGGRRLASGWHHKAGGPHAEIMALRALGDPARARGATLYITLEPCSTTGKTPPCTEAILAAGFARVVYGATDPNPKHAGRAKKILAAAGIKVTVGVLAAECEALNEAWNQWIKTGLPFVTAKAGMSLDGRISSPPGRRWITSAKARADAMLLRASCMAVLVGGQTIRDDNPRLTVRGVPCREQPIRAIWTRTGELPAEARVLTDRHAHRTRVFQKVSLRTCLARLGSEGVQSVLIEGGGRTLGEAFDNNLVDRVVFYVAPVLLGGPTPAVGGQGVAHPHLSPRLGPLTCRALGDDLRFEARVLH